MSLTLAPRPALTALMAALVLSLLAPSGLALAEDPPAEPPSPRSRLGSPEVFGYLTYWDLDAQIDYEAITTIAYFGLGAGADGRLLRTTPSGSKRTEYSRWESAKVRNIITEAQAHGVKFVLTIERFAWDEGGKAATRALLWSPEARTTLVQEIVAEVVARGIDGVTLDFEPILSDTRDQFAALLAELRAGLDAVNPDYQLTFAATGSAPALTYQMYGNVTAAGWADAVLIMAYPLRGPDARYAGGLAPLYSPTSYDLIQITNAYLNYVAADKLVMLLPWYGRQWPTETADVNARVQEDRTLYDRPHNIGYEPALRYAITHGRVVDPVEMSAITVFRWRYCADCPETWMQVYYDDVETLGFKYEWVLAQGMAGIGIWALGYDNSQPELWKLLRVKFNGLVDTAPPAGSIALAIDESFCQAPSVRLALQADDGPDGTGAVYVRLSNAPDTDAEGLLSLSRTYPAAPEIAWPMNDSSVGGVAASGPRTVYAQWRDVAGNWSPATSIGFELSLPASANVSVANGAAAAGSATVDVHVIHSGGRPIARVLLSNSGDMIDGLLANAVEGVIDGATRLSLVDPAVGGSEADGARSVHVQWQDSGGCWSDPVSTPIVLDREAPSGSLTLVDSPSLSPSGDVAVLVPATDATTEVTSVELSNDGTTWQAFAPTGDPVAWSAGDTPDGPWTISARWTDLAGNVSAPVSSSLTLDRHGPMGSLSINGGALVAASESVTIDAPGTDSASAVTTVRISNSPETVDGVLAQGQDFGHGSPIAWSLAGSGAPEGAPDGTRTVYAQWQDAVGHWSTVASAEIVLDRTAPTVTSPVTSLEQGSQLGKSSVPVAASWTAADVGSGVERTTVESARGTAAWSALPQATAATAAELQINTASTWRLRVSASDVAGNVSAPVESATFSATIAQDSSSLVTYSEGWTRVWRSAASGRTIRYAKAKGATARFKFTGRSIAWAAALGPNLGRARVFIDGRRVAFVDLQGASSQRMLVFSRTWSKKGQHTIKIRVLGTPGRPRVELDGFVVLT